MDFVDDTGDNISKYNAYFNDLTNIYWAYSNYEKLGNPEYIGFDHYRRILKYNRYALMPNVVQCKVENMGETVYDHYAKYHVKGDIDRFIARFDMEIPELSIIFHEYLGQKTTYPLAIFVMHRDLFFEYSKFLRKCVSICLNEFTIEEMDVRDKYQKRAFAFMLERMTAFWIYMKHKCDGVRVIDTVVDVYSLQSPYQRP